MAKMHILERGRLDDRESKVIDAPLELVALGDSGFGDRHLLKGIVATSLVKI